jgi:hypothetical protein
MVDKFKTILHNIESSKGSIALFALIKMDDFINKWTVVFSAAWSNPENRTETFNMIREEITKIVTPEELEEIARLAIYYRGEHIVEELLKYQSGAVLENQKVNGNMVHYADIVKSDANA